MSLAIHPSLCTVLPLVLHLRMLDALSLITYCVFVFLVGLTFTFTYLTIRDELKKN